MTERPILMSAPMVLALLEGRKTQTRRIMKVQPPDPGFHFATLVSTTNSAELKHEGAHHWTKPGIDSGRPYFRCPHGYNGDRLWVRETFKRSGFDATRGLRMLTTYKDGTERWFTVPSRDDMFLKPQWIPSIHMPRWASNALRKWSARNVARLIIAAIWSRPTLRRRRSSLDTSGSKLWRPQQTELVQP